MSSIRNLFMIKKCVIVKVQPVHSAVRFSNKCYLKSVILSFALSLKRILKGSFLISYQHLVTFAVVCTERSCSLLCGGYDLRATAVLHLYFYVAFGHIAIFWWIIQFKYRESFLYLILLSLPGCCLDKLSCWPVTLKKESFPVFLLG